MRSFVSPAGIYDVARKPPIRSEAFASKAHPWSPRAYALNVKFALESWPQGVHDLSVQSVGFEIDRTERDILDLICGEVDARDRKGCAQALASLIASDEFVHGVLSNLVVRCDEKIAQFSESPFFRLGDCSPKDSELFLQYDGRTKNGLDVIAYLATSFRAWTHLTTACAMSAGVGQETAVPIHQMFARALSGWSDERRKKEGSPLHHLPWLWFRQYHKWEPWQEFRCFMREREFVGATQYYGVDHRADGGRVVYPQIVEHAIEIERLIKRFFEDRFLLATQGYCRGCVFDVAVNLDTKSVMLIELNPAGEQTFPGLFSWEAMDFDGELRWLQDESAPIIVEPQSGDIRGGPSKRAPQP